MAHHPAHQPPPANVVAELVRAGVSITTALAMERWKAQEVLDLLKAERRNDDRPTGAPLRGTI